MRFGFLVKALAGLALCSSNAANLIQAALTKRERALKQKDRRSLNLVPAGEPAAKKGPGVCLTRPIFQYGPSCGQAVPRFATEAGLKTAADGGGAPKLDPSVPFVLSDQRSAAATVSAHLAIKDAVAAFVDLWEASPMRAFPGRAGQLLRAPASDIAAEALAGCLAGSLLHVDDAHEALRDMLAPGAFAVAAGSEYALTEKNGMPSLRVALAGFRLVVMMPVAPVRAWMRLYDPGADEPLVEGSVVKSLLKFVLRLSQEEVVNAARRFPFYFSSVGPGELLYTPANWIACEKALSSKPDGDV